MRTPSGERKATNGVLTQIPGPGLENMHKKRSAYKLNLIDPLSAWAQEPTRVDDPFGDG